MLAGENYRKTSMVKCAGRAGQWIGMAASRLMVAGALALLGGCGGGGSAAPADPGQQTTGEVANAFPLGIGNTWIYQKRNSDTGESLKVDRITTTASVQGETATVVERLNALTGQVEDKTYYARSGRSVMTLFQGSGQFSGLQRLEYLRLPLTTGESFVPVDTPDQDMGEDLDGDGRHDLLAVRAEVTVEAIEDAVTVPAGTFRRCGRVKTLLTETYTMSRSNERYVVTTTYTDWYAPDVGLIHNREVVTLPAGDVYSEDELLLTGYRVGGVVGGDSSGPVVREVSPAPDQQIASGTLRTVTPLTVTFDRPLDATGTDKNALTLLDAAGQPVDGKLTVSGNQIRLQTAIDLPGGVYTARLQPTVKDWLQQAPQAGQTWTFRVDTQGPAIVRHSPAAGDQNAAFGNTILIEFDDELDPNAVKDNTITVTDYRFPSSPTTSWVKASVQGRQLALVPTSTAMSYDPGVAYDVTIPAGAVRDLRGNLLAAPYTFSFRKSPGQLDVPIALNTSPSSTQALAVGDVNGDGRSDLVAFIRDWNPYGSWNQAYLAIHHRRADGALEANPVKFPINQINAQTIAIGDIDGDGRVDIVASSKARWFPTAAIPGQPSALAVYQSDPATGVWRETQRYDGLYSDSFQMVDTDGDGRLDLVGVQVDGFGLEIRRQGADGRLQPPQPLAIAPDYMSDSYPVGVRRLLIVDITGDGRPDLVTAAGNSSGFANTARISVQPGLVGGGFGPAVHQHPAGLTTIDSWAASDFNQDGRTDLALLGKDSRPLFDNDRLALMLQTPSGAPGSLEEVNKAYLLSTTDNGFERLAAVDMDGDGQTDLVRSSFSLAIHLLMRSTGTTSFAPQVPYNTPSNFAITNAMVVTDVNGDGRPDVVIGDVFGGGYLYYPGTPKATPVALGVGGLPRGLTGTARLKAWMEAQRRRD